MSDTRALLDVKGLQVHFDTPDGVVKAVNDVDFEVKRGETLAVVGESGSGKSVTSLAIMRLISGRNAGGKILFEGKNLLDKSMDEMRGIRGNDISMIFQEPMTSLNPVYTVGWQIIEAITTHLDYTHKQAYERAVESLDLVGIPEPRARMSNYPHQLSGGMRQRVMIAMALSTEPKLLIADEPTTALDVTIQAQILQLMRRLQREMGMSIIFITHDLAVVAEMAHRVVVMYSGNVVEEAPVSELFKRPRMPYTIGLMRSMPGRYGYKTAKNRLEIIPGNVPNPLQLPSGCAFHPRCKFMKPGVCTTEAPKLEPIEDDRLIRCFRWEDVQEQVQQETTRRLA
ncbi:ABC transporter ATP-binding protein [Halomonas sp. ML-15]|uniref:ABC transporter ATP-binding protein n=1 Tax=Halomonas sp. ML-15 TaxID=2773305 RepID=UPI001746D237|nr:ABC transporter ATP-binding protein [Halomonas sp. ML-15]MBD3896357.1 ABC transporter ATP-binding protein [Halomonas sp. ML-15]